MSTLMRMVWVLAVACVLAVSPLGVPATAQEAPATADAPTVASQPPSLVARAAVLVDLDTGHVLYRHNERQRVPVASLTKMMTALVVRDLYNLDEVVTVSNAVLPVRGGKLGIVPGMQYTVRDLLYAMLMMSGNDTASALADHHPLGYRAFIEAMNVKAQSIGAVNSNFANPHGMDEAGHLSTAWDQALIAQRLMADPVLAEIVATPTYTISWVDDTTRTFRNHNKLVGSHDGALGVKTGFTTPAGRCLAAASHTGRGRALTIVLNSQAHYEDTTALFDYHAAAPAMVPLVAMRPPPPVAPEQPEAESTMQVAAAPAATPEPAPAMRWVMLPMGLLAACMLLTLRRPRRMHPIQEAAAFHAYLEPLAAPDTTVVRHPEPVPDDAHV